MTSGSDDLLNIEARAAPDVLFRELAGEAVLLDLKTQRYYGLDPVGTRIWQLLAESGRTADVLQAMLDEFDIDRAKLERDLQTFLDELEGVGLIELGHP